MLTKSSTIKIHKEEFLFPYQTIGRIDTLNVLHKSITDNNFDNFLNSTQRKKTKCISYFIHGSSGIGKTRFSGELLSLLYNHKPSYSIQNVDKLKKFQDSIKPESSFTILLDLKNNGDDIHNVMNEIALPPNIIIGLRVASKYWFPKIKYLNFLEVVKQNFSDIIELFDVNTIVSFMNVYPPYGWKTIPSSIHISVDEIQTVFTTDVKHHSESNKTEPLSRGLNRALLNSTSFSSSIFILVKFAGTSFDSLKIYLEPTDLLSQSIPLPPLSKESILNIVKSFIYSKEKKIIKGQDWLNLGKKFKRILYSLGGNPRALESLFQTY